MKFCFIDEYFLDNYQMYQSTIKKSFFKMAKIESDDGYLLGPFILFYDYFGEQLCKNAFTGLSNLLGDL